MLRRFYPYEYVDSVFVLDYGKIFRKSFRGIIFDIDMTLVPHGEDSTPEVDALFEEIHACGLKTLLLTNNDEPRVKRFVKNIDTLYICDAEKPNPKNYLKAVELLGIKKEETIFVGDQIFIDIFGANKSDIANVLVNYVTAYEKKISVFGGGLCNLGNTIHYVVLHSLLTVVEFHHHSDALAPDHGKRIPFSSGTSISYNYIDYRFKNETEQDVQLKLWCADERLYGELRSEREFSWRYELVEEEHRLQREGEKFFRVSKIYRNVIDRATEKILRKELILNNHSEVMYDYNLIPDELIQS